VAPDGESGNKTRFPVPLGDRSGEQIADKWREAAWEGFRETAREDCREAQTEDGYELIGKWAPSCRNVISGSKGRAPKVPGYSAEPSAGYWKEK